MSVVCSTKHSNVEFCNAATTAKFFPSTIFVYSSAFLFLFIHSIHSSFLFIYYFAFYFFYLLRILELIFKSLQLLAMHACCCNERQQRKLEELPSSEQQNVVTGLLFAETRISYRHALFSFLKRLGLYKILIRIYIIQKMKNGRCVT